MVRRLVVLVAVVALAAPAMAREMTSSYVITAVANLPGSGGTDWHTDLTLYNPHQSVLQVKLVFLPTDTDNSGGAPTAPFSVQPWETLNLWDVLGPHGFNARGTKGAMLVYADAAANNCPTTAGDTTCDFAVFARNYTLDPNTNSNGEFGQDFPGFPSGLGVDSSVIAYMPQISDDSDFRTNVGVASWTKGWVTVREDIQDASGNIVGRHDHQIPPNGHTQWRLEDGLTGGTVAVYVVSGPSDIMVYPYATVVNWTTGDATTVEAHISKVGLSAQAAAVRPATVRAVPEALPVPTFSLEALKRRSR